MTFILFEGNKITLWRDLTKLESRKINAASFKHPAAVRKCVFSKGCKYLATYATDGVLRVFMVSFMDVESPIQNNAIRKGRIEGIHGVL